MSDIGNPKGTNEDLGSDVRYCFCCGKKDNRNELTTISATTSGKCRDGTGAENRFICKKCNHLKENKDV